MTVTGRASGAQRGRRLLVALSIAVSASAITAVLAETEFFDRVEATSYDRRVRATAQPVDPSIPIVIIDISESSVRALEPVVGRWPWPRAVHAALIDYVAAAGAKVIAYDVLFGEREGRSQTVVNGRTISGDESDRALVESVRAAGNVVLLGDATFEGASTGAGGATPAIPEPIGLTLPAIAGFEPRPTFQAPFDDLGRAARGVGHNYLRREGGTDFAREMRPLINLGTRAVPALGLAAALAYLDVPFTEIAADGSSLRVGDRMMPLAGKTVVTATGSTLPSRQAILRFASPTAMDASGVRGTFESYSFFDALLSSDQRATGKAPAVPPEAFAGKLVFVGTSAAGLFDRYQTPFGGGMGGVELHATLAANLISRHHMRPPSLLAGVALTAGAALAAALVAVYLPVLPATLTVLLGLGGLLTVLTLAVGRGHWLPAIAPTLGALVALFLGVAWQYFVEGRQKREIKRLFGRYVSKDVIEQLIANPALAGLGGQRRTMTVLFSDIRGFTTASERATPEAVVAQLNEYFGAMVEVLFRHRGTLDKFVGDMVMGLFAAPLDDPDHADHAVAAAVEMIETLERLNDRWRTEGRPVLDIGIGINTGDMIAGNVGAEAIMSYTVIGDAVNLGARLESLNKELGTRILISEATRQQLRQPIATRPKGAVTVKGKTEAVLVHEVIGRQAEGFQEARL